MDVHANTMKDFRNQLRGLETKKDRLEDALKGAHEKNESLNEELTKTKKFSKTILPSRSPSMFRKDTVKDNNKNL